MITIFTPVYNRATLIHRLYESLCRQSCKNFEWLVVDDGSVDEIDKVINTFIAQESIEINYIKQSNGGKHRAINRGIDNARGELFFIVDSDDWLPDDAVEWIAGTWENLKSSKEQLAGFSGLKVNMTGSPVIKGGVFEDLVSDAIEIRTKYGIVGDLAEIFKTSVLKDFYFPDIEGEFFCAEGLVWNRIAEAGFKLKYYYNPVCFVEYQPDGLSASNVSRRRDSPGYSMLLYKEQIKSKKFPVRRKIKSALLYWRFSEKSKESFFAKAKAIPAPYILLAFPGWLLRKLPGK